MEITSEVYQVGGEGFTSVQDAAIFLIRVNDQAVLIDSGCGFEIEKLVKNIEATGTVLNQIQLILLTHCHFDHSGGASELKEKIGCKIVAHQLDAEYLESANDSVTAATWYQAKMPVVKIDRKLKTAHESINVGGRDIEAIHIPGHSPGSVAYLIESEGKSILFGQDVHGPLHPSLLSNEKEYKESLNKMIMLDADILCEGHFGVIEGKKRVADFIRSYI